MKVIGFNFDEIHAKKTEDIKRPNISTDVTFTDVDRAKVEALKDGETIKAKFKFLVSYKDAEKNSKEVKNELTFNGSMFLMVDKDESKEFLKAWKSKEIPKDKMLGLYNFILRKCSVKALQLEEELNLQPHIPFPQARAQNTKMN